MTLKYADQYTYAVDPARQHQVSMGLFKKASTMLTPGTPPLTAGTTQPQRNALVQLILRGPQPTAATGTFTNYVVGDASLVTVDDITDAKVDSLLTTAVVDAVAALFFPGI